MKLATDIHRVYMMRVDITEKAVKVTGQTSTLYNETKCTYTAKAYISIVRRQRSITC